MKNNVLKSFTKRPKEANQYKKEALLLLKPLYEKYKKDPYYYAPQVTEVLETICRYVLLSLPYNVSILDKDLFEELVRECIPKAWESLKKADPDVDNKKLFNYIRICTFYHAQRIMFDSVDRFKLERSSFVNLDSPTAYGIEADPTETSDELFYVEDQELIRLVNRQLNASNRKKTKLSQKDHTIIRQTLKLSRQDYEERLENLLSEIKA